MACTGPLLAAEIDAITKALANPKRPLVTIVALAAVIAPDVPLTEDSLGPVWRDARTWGALAAAYYFWRHGHSHALPVAIAVGMAVYLPLRLWFN